MVKPVLVTGAAKRVGRAVALELARRGHDILFTYLASEADAFSLAAEIRALGRQTAQIKADLSHPAQSIEQVVTAVRGHTSHLAGLVNNASIYKPDDPTDTELAQRMWRIHVESPVRLTRSLAPELTAGRGCVINMVDILAQRPMKGWLAYCTSKAGLWNATAGLARELAPNARCCGIAPGVVEWPTDYPEAEKAKYLARVPLKRAGSPEDVARLVHFLMNEGTYITGQVIALDGGRSIA